MPVCSGICKDGTACYFQAKAGNSVCGKHMAQNTLVAPQPPVVLCGKHMTTGTPCTNPCGEGLTQCVRHDRLERDRVARQIARRTWADTLDVLWTTRVPEDARQFLTQKFTEGVISASFFLAYMDVLVEEIAFFHQLHPEALVPLKGELHALSLDNQSVHTGVVNKQTQEGLDVLLETPVVQSELSAVMEIANLWTDKHPLTLVAVVKDMRNWYKTKTCRTKDDALYKRALDGLWARIKLSPAKEDLLQRLWEECHESLNMCCEGHISRLCNVMCGFDDAFKAPISVGELLQQRMAAIAEKEVDVNHKVGEAWAVFEELSTPMGERMSWLSAF